MFERTVVVKNRAGVHARPSAILVQAAKDFKCAIYFEQGENRINGKSIMSILTLGAAYGSELKIIAEGEDEEAAVNLLAHLFETKFEED